MYNESCSNVQMFSTIAIYVFVESCQTLPNVAGGSVELVSTGTITQGNFSCDVGYTMNGVSILTCRSDGSWDLSPPSCGK